jgi:flagellar hook-length control protein FliK
MQVNLTSSAGFTWPSGSNRVMLLPDIAQLLQPSPAARDRREQIMEEGEDKLRRKDLEREDVAASAASTPRPSELMLKAEQEMAPGSHAARQQQLHDQLREQVSQKPADFRQALTEATSRGAPERPSTPPSNAQKATGDVPASENAATPDTGDGKPVRPADSGTVSTPQAVARPQPSMSLSSVSPVPPTAVASPAVSATASPVTAVQAGEKIIAVAGSGATVSVGAPSSAGEARAPSGPPVVAEVSPPSASNAKALARPAAPSDPEPRSNDENVERILRFIQTRIGKERSVATLRLEPPELGTLRLRMDLRADELTLEVETQTVAARKLLTEHTDTLRRSLEAAGIHLERVEVRAAPSTEASEAHSQPHGDVWTGAEGNPARQDAEQPRAPAWGSEQVERPPVELSDTVDGTAFLEPVAESLVNVWA